MALIPRERGISCVRARVLPSLKNRESLPGVRKKRNPRKEVADFGSSCVMALLLAQSALTLNAPPGVLSPDTQHVVYIIGGQSQAAGKGLTNELTSKERDRASALGDRVIVEYPSVSRDIDPGLLEELDDALRADHNMPSVHEDPRTVRTVDRNRDCRISPGSWYLGEVANGSKGCTFGPEIGFGIRIAEAMPNRRITILKVSWPGVDIITWRKALYPTVLSSLRRFKENHGEFVLGGMLWLHGEYDSGLNEPDFLSTNVTVSIMITSNPGPPPIFACSSLIREAQPLGDSFPRPATTETSYGNWSLTFAQTRACQSHLPRRPCASTTPLGLNSTSRTTSR